MITQDWNQLTLILKFQECLDHFTTIRTSIDIVSQSDNDVIFSGGDVTQQCLQRQIVPVNIANRDQSIEVF